MNRHLRGLRRLALATPLILVGLAHPAVAQRLPFRTFTEVDGAPSSAFGTGVQDSDGRLWVASRAGLAMYDGVEWTLEVDEAGMLHIALGAVQMDGAGRLWATVQATPPRVFRRDPDGWRQLPSPEPLASGWSSDLTVLAVEPVAEAPRCAIADLVNRVFIYAAGQWRRVDFAERDRVHAAAWHDGRLLVATAFGLKSVDCPADGPITVTELDGLPAGPAYAVIPPHGSLPLVVAGRGWLGTYDQGHYQPLAADARLALTVPYLGVSAVRDSVGGVWIGDRGTVVRWHPLLGLSLVEPAQGLPSAGTSGLLTDREGQVWIMNARGISVLADQRLETFDRTTGLFANEVSSIVLMPDGRAVLGHEGGLTFLDPAPSVLPIAGPDRSGRVMGACPDGRGGAWLACGRTGLVHLDSGHRAEIVVAPDEVTSWLSGVARTGDGTLWVSSHKGLHRLRGHRLEPVDLSPLPLAGEASLRRVLDVPGFGVVATSSRRGVVRVDGQGVHWMISTETAANSTFDVLDAGGGILWVGTGCGLRRIVDDAIVPMGPGDPVIDRPVYAITRGADGTVWFGTDAGVRTWDGHTLGALTPREGLRGAESNRDALKCDALGRIWIGTDRGLNIWDGRFAAPPLALPRARIEGFEVDGRPHAADVPLELAPSVRELRIHVRSDALRLGRQQRFQTRLVGYDPGWSEPHLLPDGVLRFTSLPAGRYHFEVRALAADGQPGPVAASPTMHVAQPLWRRPWLIAVNVAALLALAWLVSGGISARRYARRLQGEVKARTAELAASEQRLRHESHRLAVVLDSVGDGVIVVDTTGRITLGNPAAATLVGAAPGALDGRQLEDVLPGVTGLVREAAAAAVTGTSTFLGAGGTFRFQA
ncbi:MAG TPA: PAS domain-containing protein, partial [Candidatus Krumholzibacteria bacterium]|nr:PAS domain-containing protein [Candidatus Krumholzibacteria bacterium]